ncbi:hypothetical protein B0A50_02692 [Salinomyces thailandicus]|uniref:CBF1-interacting co-repressor CIR N-terminal domain-containing protein n=1 Tax=Salinomyces thailandicus TaxID=706561 RepID=A0A4U0U674_9PEZI|nr:hypothetical protein B0A50_02692 [Salinomyces thailandica]
MPLHLLGKKSWNVYNQANVDRVRRDEAAAQAREEAEEQRMQDEDAAGRIALLRGELSAPALSVSAPVVANSEGRGSAHAEVSPKGTRDADHGGVRDRKRRRLRGEDDTDRDIRYAREDAEAGEKVRKTLVQGEEKNVPLVDHAGHLQLVPAPDAKEEREACKNAEGEAEKERKRKREEDEYTMRFRNAAGFRQGMQDPWYASNKLPHSSDGNRNTAAALAELQEKDVWGNEDSSRRERERSRMSSNDPFAAMQNAQRQLKQNEFDRSKWQKEKEVELKDLKRDQERSTRRRKTKHRHGTTDEDEDGLGGFSLDAPARRSHDHSGQESHRHRRRQRHHSRSRSREREKHRNRHSTLRDG